MFGMSLWRYTKRGSTGWTLPSLRALLLLTLVTLATNSVPAYSQDALFVWERTVGQRSIDWANAVAATPDGGMTVAGWSNTRGRHGGYAWLLRLDRAGKKLWGTRHGGPDEDRFYDVVALPSGNSVAVGFTQAEGGRQTLYLVTKIDRRGKTIWQRTYRKHGNDWALSVTSFPDESVTVAGYASSKKKGKEVWVLRLDRDGEVIWDKTFHSSDFAWAWGVTALGDGGVVVAADEAKLPTGDQKAWIFRLDEAGNKLWEWRSDPKKVAWIKDIVPLEDDGFIVVGSTAGVSSFESIAWAIRLDRRGTKIWERTFGTQRIERFNRVIRLSNGRLVVVGMTEDKSLESGIFADLVVARMDLVGRLVSVSKYGGRRHDAGYGAAELSNGDIAVVGVTRSKGAGSADAWIMRLAVPDESGRSPPQ